MHPDMITKLLNTVGAVASPLKRFEAMFGLGVLMGLRRGEVLGLKWDCVDFIDRKIRVERSLRRIHGDGLVLGKLKTKKSERTIPMPLNVANILAERNAFRTPSARPLAMSGWRLASC
jgi:integrase